MFWNDVWARLRIWRSVLAFWQSTILWSLEGLIFTAEKWKPPQLPHSPALCALCSMPTPQLPHSPVLWARCSMLNAQLWSLSAVMRWSWEQRTAQACVPSSHKLFKTVHPHPPAPFSLFLHAYFSTSVAVDYGHKITLAFILAVGIWSDFFSLLVPLIRWNLSDVEAAWLHLCRAVLVGLAETADNSTNIFHF